MTENKKYFIATLKKDRDFLYNEIESVFAIKKIRFNELELLTINNFVTNLKKIGYEIKEICNCSLDIGFIIEKEKYLIYDNKMHFKIAVNPHSCKFLLGINCKKIKSDIKELFDLIDLLVDKNKNSYTGSNEWKFDICRKYNIPMINTLAYLNPKGKYWYNNQLCLKEFPEE